MSAPVKDLGPQIPLDQDRREKAAVIKLWTRNNLPLTEETVVSVNEFACIKPDCPKRQTVILLLSEDAPTRLNFRHSALRMRSSSRKRATTSSPPTSSPARPSRSPIPAGSEPSPRCRV